MYFSFLVAQKGAAATKSQRIIKEEAKIPLLSKLIRHDETDSRVKDICCGAVDNLLFFALEFFKAGRWVACARRFSLHTGAEVGADVVLQSATRTEIHGMCYERGTNTLVMCACVEDQKDKWSRSLVAFRSDGTQSSFIPFDSDWETVNLQQLSDGRILCGTRQSTKSWNSAKELLVLSVTPEHMIRAVTTFTIPKEKKEEQPEYFAFDVRAEADLKLVALAIGKRSEVRIYELTKQNQLAIVFAKSNLPHVSCVFWAGPDLQALYAGMDHSALETVAHSTGDKRRLEDGGAAFARKLAVWSPNRWCSAGPTFVLYDDKDKALHTFSAEMLPA